MQIEIQISTLQTVQLMESMEALRNWHRVTETKGYMTAKRNVVLWAES